MRQTVASKFFFSLEAIKSQSFEEGALTSVTAHDVPGFVNISFENLRLHKGAILLPIWYPNAAKLCYCTEGRALVTMRTPSKVENFSVESGEMFFIPQGYVHSIQNGGENECVLKCALNHVLPEVMHFAAAIYSLSDTVFNATFNSSSGFVEGLKRSKSESLITTAPLSKETVYNPTSVYKFDIGKSAKPVLTKGGYLQLGTKKTLPTLEGLGILRFGLNAKGAVEPHWHTNAGELVYIVKGKTCITLLSPNGAVEIVEVNGGEGIFAPASYFHNIENVGLEPVEVIAFFSHADPDYIGIGEVMGAYSSEVLASVFKVNPSYFENFKKPEAPLIIVPL